MVKINELSKIGIGTYRMSVDDLESENAIRYSILSGINIIDTASNYNFGKSELLIGKIIDENIRDSVFIVSKAGYIQGDDINDVRKKKLNHIEINENFFYSIESDFISFQLEKSLKRLNTNYIDCYLLHNPEYCYEKLSKEQSKNILFNSFSLLEQKVKEKKIRYYGISSNSLNLLPLKDILETLERYPHLKVLQFPYNIIEQNSLFKVDEFQNISIQQLKNKGFTILSNRPLNTIYDNKVLRLVDNPIENIDYIEKQEDVLFSSLKSTISKRLIEMGEEAILENYYPINFFIENRKVIANQEAIDKSISAYLIPFLDALALNNKEIIDTLKSLRNYWINFSLNENQKRLDIVKNKLYAEGVLEKNNEQDLSAILAEKYTEDGINVVLMGLTKERYVDKIKSIL